MFGRKKDQVYLELSTRKKRLLINAMAFFRDMLLETGRLMEDINELFL